MTNDGEDASDQEAEHHTIDDDDGRLRKEEERSEMEYGRAIEELHREVELQLERKLPGATSFRK